MATFGTTLFFQSTTGDLGWSETYYMTQTDYPAAIAAAPALINVRKNILVSLYKIVGGRVSNVAVSGDSQLLPDLPVVGSVAATPETATEPWTALNVRIESSSAHRGRRFVRGIQEETFFNDRTYDDTNADNAAWQAYWDYLIANTLLKHKVSGVVTYGIVSAAFPIRETMKRVGRPFGLLSARTKRPAA